MDQEQIQRYTAHIKRYERTPLVRNVLVGDTTFQGEVDDFYGIDLTKAKVKDESSGGLKETPDQLVDVVSEFAWDGLDKSKLQCSNVRADYYRWHSDSRFLGQFFSLLGSPFVATAGILCSLALLDEGNTQQAILAGGLGVLGSEMLFRFAIESPRGTNNENYEYRKLRGAAYNADCFIKDTYRKLLIRENLERE
jgi:hypothetical protein